MPRSSQRLKAADAVLIGKTNMDEFAMGGSTENSAFQTTRNPWDLQRIPGGSSGGAAAAWRRRMAPLSIGTDTGGSIRQPAGLCGVTGLKPTYGRVSRYGLVAFASSLDQIGPLARTAEDAALLLEVIAGHDPLDSTSVDVPVPAYYRDRRASRSRGCGSAWCASILARGSTPKSNAAVREAVDVYKSLGATVRELSLPHGKYGVATYYIIAPCEASSNLARYDGVHYGHRTDETATAWPHWRPSGRRWRPPASTPRPKRSTIRWCGCIAAAAPKVLAPKSSGGSCSAPTP